MGQHSELLTVREVAERLKLKESTIRAWLMHKRIAAVRVGRRAIRIPLTAVEALIEAGTIVRRERR